MKKTIATIFNRAKTKNKGFTLIELLAVIVILAIVLVVTIPSVINSMNSAKKSQLENAAKSVADWLTKQYELTNLGGGVSSASPEYTSFVSAYGEYPNSYYTAASFARNLASCNDESLSMLKAAGISKPDTNIDLDNSYVWKNENKIAVAISAKDGGSFYTSGGKNIVFINTGNISLKILPDDYQEVEYIQSDGHCCIDTGIILNDGDEIETDFEWLGSFNNNGKTDSFFFGTQHEDDTKGGAWVELYKGNNSIRWFVRYSSKGSWDAPLEESQKKGHMVLKQKEFTIDGTSVLNPNYSGTFQNTTLTIFNRKSKTEALIETGSYIKIWNFTIKNNGEYRYRGIPCKNKDGVIGLYDMVTGTFQANSDENGELIAGANILF